MKQLDIRYYVEDNWSDEDTAQFMLEQVKHDPLISAAVPLVNDGFGNLVEDKDRTEQKGY